MLDKKNLRKHGEGGGSLHSLPQEIAALPGARIMVVEDEPYVSKYLRELVVRLGHTVVGWAASGDVALLDIARLKPDLILMDIAIQGDIDGIETVKRMPQDMDIPVIYVTVNADAKTVEAAAGTKPRGYLLKPVESRQLQANILLALGRPSELKPPNGPKSRSFSPEILPGIS